MTFAVDLELSSKTASRKNALKPLDEKKNLLYWKAFFISIFPLFFLYSYIQYIPLFLTLITLLLFFLNPYMSTQALRLVYKQQTPYKVSNSCNVPMQHLK